MPPESAGADSISSRPPPARGGRPWKYLPAAALVLALLLRLAFAWASLVNLPATGDEAAAVLLARMIAGGEFPLLFLGQPYQFPIEAYLMAPLVEWMPPNAFGARYQMLGLGLLSVFGFLLILRNAYPPGSRWPAALLVLFPSAYLLMTTSAYAPPQYSMAVTLAWLGIYLALKVRQAPDNRLLPLLTGLVCGLALSNHMLTVTVSVGVFTLVLFGGSARRAVRDALLLGVGFAAGAIPYLLALWVVPGAYEGLATMFSPGRALSRLVDPVITEAFAGAMGFDPPLLPDFPAHLGWPHMLRTLFAGSYIALILVLLGQRLPAFFRAVVERRWPSLQLVDLALIVSLLAFGLFTFRMTATVSYRYLLPAVWVFPFLVGHLHAEARGWGRRVVGGASVALALCNVAISMELVREWSRAAGVERFTGTYDIGPLLGELRKRGVRHCYASFWLAYRVTLESGGEIVCTPPFNERFRNWPLPFHHEVDTDPGTVFVLTQKHGARFTILDLKKDLRESGIRARTSQVGPFRIFSDFSQESRGDPRLDPRSYTLRTDGEVTDLSALSDFDRNTYWVSSRKQYAGQGLEVEFEEPQVVSEVSLFNIPGKRNGAGAYRVLGRIDGDWVDLTHTVKVPEKLERWRFAFGHPVYGELRHQQVLLPPKAVEALRVEIAKPETHAYWGLTGLEIHVRNGEEAAGAAQAEGGGAIPGAGPAMPAPDGF